MRFTSLLVFTLATICATASAQRSEAFVQQVGSLNVVSVTQVSSHVSLRQINGDENLVFLEQREESHATILQDGSRNRLLGLGGSEATALSLGGSTLFVTQLGMDNTAFIEQSMGSYAAVTQIGSNNTATIIQM